MPANNNSSATSQSPVNPANQDTSSNAAGSKQSNTKTLLVIVVVLLIAIALVLIFVLQPSAGTGPSVLGTTTAVVPSLGSTGGTPIYLSASQSQILLGQVSIYSTSDLFNASSPINITYMYNVTPYAAGNVTEGWVTMVQGQNLTKNQSIYFLVMYAYNASSLSSSIVSSVSQFYSSPPQTLYGTVNGLSYTYQLYENSTGNFQSITGWKGRDAVFVQAFSNPGFPVNYTVLAGIAANET